MNDKHTFSSVRSYSQHDNKSNENTSAIEVLKYKIIPEKSQHCRTMEVDGVESSFSSLLQHTAKEDAFFRKTSHLTNNRRADRTFDF
jgi:hypothetical protein